MNEVPEMRSVLREKGGSWGLFMPMGRAPGMASELFLSVRRKGSNELRGWY